jgi:glycine cleavage system H protein
MNFPEELKYTEEHEWIKLDGDVATIGITDFAQGELGDIVYVDVNTAGDQVEQNEIFGSVEAVKTVSDLFMPLTGEVLEVNELIDDKPELVNNDPYGDGWIIKVKVADKKQFEELLSASAYKEMIGK